MKIKKNKTILFLLHKNLASVVQFGSSTSQIMFFFVLYIYIMPENYRELEVWIAWPLQAFLAIAKAINPSIVFILFFQSNNHHTNELGFWTKENR